MEKVKPSEDIARLLKDVSDRTPPDIKKMGEAVNAFKAAWPTTSGLYVQLQQLSDFIDKSKSELAAFRPDDVKQHFIPKATDELDAIVEATAEATHRIMDAADVIMSVSEKLPAADADKVMAAVTSIYEASTFQDITGQRVTKVIGTLKVIEERIDKMMAGLADLGAATATGSRLGGAESLQPSQPQSVSSQDDIDALFTSGSTLEGPALPSQAKSQAEIDDLFNKSE